MVVGSNYGVEASRGRSPADVTRLTAKIDYAPDVAATTNGKM